MEHKTIIYIFDTDDLINANNFNTAYELMSEERKKKIDTYKFDKDKRLALGAGLLIRMAVLERGANYDIEKVRYNEFQKPYYNIKDFHFNVSHSGNLVMIGISNKEVGCDIEKIREIDLNVARRFFDIEEYEAIRYSEDEGKSLDLFYRTWTIKESFLKNLGLGLSESLKKYCFVNELDKNRFKKEIDNNIYYFKLYDDINGYKISICSKSEDIDEVRYVDLKRLMSV